MESDESEDLFDGVTMTFPVEKKEKEITYMQ